MSHRASIASDRTLTHSQRPDRFVLPPRLVPSGTRIGRYEIDAPLGEGGTAVVYRAYDRAGGRAVAFKMLHANLLGNGSLRRRFRQEAELMRSWRHAGVVEVYDFVEDERLSAAVMELVAGPTLEDYLSDLTDPLDGHEIAALIRPLLGAMGAAHRRGIVHRDLKPRNVLLAPAGPKVSDFGIAKLLGGPTFTEEGTLLGSCRYMAPEQAQSAADVDHRADIYSLGVILYRALTGRCPFEGSHPLELIMAHATQPAVAPSALRPGLPGEVDRLVLDCLAKRPEERPSSCRELDGRLASAISAMEPS